jgi:hypothetical protein
MKNGAVGFCASEDGHLLGFVGVLDLATRTINRDVEYVGGIYGVATMPNCVRRGVSTLLMKCAHEYFEEKGYRFSFLVTNRTIVAHSFYGKLGYMDILEAPSAYRVLDIRTPFRGKTKESLKTGMDRLMRIYNKCVQNCTGFVVRDEAHFRMLQKMEGLAMRNCIIGGCGYVLFKKQWNGVWIRELVALSKGEMNRLIRLVEEKAKDLVYDRTVMDSQQLDVYRSRVYMIHERSHSVMMVKPLHADASFRETYGGKFSLTGLDFF